MNDDRTTGDRIGGQWRVAIAPPRASAQGAAPKQLLAEEVFWQIGSEIVSGRLEPGARLRDAELAVSYNVSRTPVREALQRLERIGLVEMSPSRYTRVTVPTEKDIDDARRYTAYQIGMVCAMSVGRMPAEASEHAAELVDRVRESFEDPDSPVDAREELFAFLAREADNALHMALITEPSLTLSRNMHLWRPTAAQREHAVAACAELRAGILAGDTERAERAARSIYGID